MTDERQPWRGVGPRAAQGKQYALKEGKLVKILSLLLALFFATVSHAQVSADSVLKSDDLRADAAILRSAYEQLHPGLYRYEDKAAMERNFADLNHQFDHDQTLQDAFLVFSEFAAKVRCGHTQANPFNQSKPVIEQLFKRPTRLPFYFVWLDGHMIVTRDFTPERIFPAGTELTKIDGVSASTILNRLLSITRADGANDSKRIAQLAVNGDSEYETFDLYYPMFFPHTGARYAITLLKPNSRRAEQASVVPLTYEQRIAPLIGTFPTAPAPDAGVTPDIVVKITSSDIATGCDVEMATAMAAARR
jgi:hypothetical protein